MNTELLIAEVEQRRCIWDISDPRHCMRDQVSKAWFEIGAILNVEADTLKRRWKSLRDNFRTELKKVPIGKFNGEGLPVDQYLSKWPFFKMMFFLREPIMGRKKSAIQEEARRDISSPVPAVQCENAESQSEEQTISRNITRKAPRHGIQVVSLKRPNKRRILDSDIGGNDNLIQMEREKIEVKKQKVLLQIEDKKRREREEEDADRHFLLSLLPQLRNVPEHKKLITRIKLQETLLDAIFRDGESNEEYTSASQWTLQ